MLIDLLAGLARESGAAIVVARHLRKGSGRALHAGLGGLGVVGSARAGYLVALDPEDDEVRALACTKLNLGPIPPALAYRVSTTSAGVGRVVWLGESERRADDLNRAATRDRSAHGEAENFLLDALADGPRRTSEVGVLANDAMITLAALRRAKRKLAVESNRVGGFAGDGCWIWYLPAHTRAALDVAARSVPDDPP